MTILRNNTNTLPIAFFDSGVGGLTVFNKVKQILPNENYIYYGDTANMPYGDKSKEQLLELSNNIFKFFEMKNCKAVVMACNTTSSVVYDAVKNNYNFKIYPIVQSVAKMLSLLEIKRLGIFATKATILSGVYEREIGKYNNDITVIGQYCPQWVHIVEGHSMNEEQNIQIIKQDLMKMLEKNPQKIVLGCTHYPFLIDILSEFAPQEMFIDPAIDFAQYIKADLTESSLLNQENKGTEEFYVSSHPESFKTAAQMFYELKQTPNLLKL